MMAAMTLASTEVVSLLLECGVNVERVDVMGNDAFMLASVTGRSENVKYWLDRFKEYDLERENFVLGATSLIISTTFGSNKIDTVRTLCSRGAHANALTHAGLSVSVYMFENIVSVFTTVDLWSDCI